MLQHVPLLLLSAAQGRDNSMLAGARQQRSHQQCNTQSETDTLASPVPMLAHAHAATSLSLAAAAGAAQAIRQQNEDLKQENEQLRRQMTAMNEKVSGCKCPHSRCTARRCAQWSTPRSWAVRLRDLLHVRRRRAFARGFTLRLPLLRTPTACCMETDAVACARKL
jgi:hypothetical protein